MIFHSYVKLPEDISWCFRRFLQNASAPFENLRDFQFTLTLGSLLFRARKPGVFCNGAGVVGSGVGTAVLVGNIGKPSIHDKSLTYENPGKH